MTRPAARATRPVALTRLEFWLLDVSVELRIGVHSVAASDDAVSQSFNRRGHGCAPDEVIRTILRLERRGWIELRCGRRVVRPTARTLSVRPADPASWIWFGPTPAGGRVWESFARPSWDLYLSLWFTPDAYDDPSFPDRAEFHGVDRRWIEKWLPYVQDSYALDMARAEWRPLRGFRPAPWKRLSSAWRLHVPSRNLFEGRSIEPRLGYDRSELWRPRF